MKKLLKIIIWVAVIFVVALSILLLWLYTHPATFRYEIAETEYRDIHKLTVFTGKLVTEEEVKLIPYIPGVVAEIYKGEHDWVKKDEVIARIDVTTNLSDLQAAEAVTRTVNIEYENTKKMYDRQTNLYKQGVISESDMEKTTVAFRKVERELKRAKDNLEIVKTGHVVSESNASNILVKSTIDGVVLTVPVKKGTTVVPANVLTSGTVIATIGDTRKIIFISNVDETEIAHLYVGMPLRLILGTDENITVPGKIEFIALQGEEIRKASFYEIKASVEIPDSLFRPGMSANAEISLAKKEHVLTIPESTISFEHDSTFVYLAHKKAFKYVYERRHVELGLSDKIHVEVLYGLQDGDLVRSNKVLIKKK